MREARFVPRDQALRDLRASAGLAETIDSLPHNPLPDAFVIDAPDTGAETQDLHVAKIVPFGQGGFAAAAAWLRRAITRKSSGRESLARSPYVVVISSPRANRTATRTGVWSPSTSRR